MKPDITPPLTWSAYKAANPRTRIRNAAAELGISELELLSTDLGTSCTRLRPDMINILEMLPSLGTVMALTRSEAAVHEVTEAFSELHIRKQTALFLRPGQDTRYFTAQWKHVFAVNEDNRRSLQFFNGCGEAIHKIFLVKSSNTERYEQLIEQFSDADQSPVLSVEKKAPAETEQIHIDKGALLQRWSQIKDVHEGSQIIKAFGGDRLSIYQALGEEYATRLPYDTIEALLKLLSKRQLPSMIFVQNKGAVQSYSGITTRLLRTGPWFNVLDPYFNLHLNTEQISQVWLIVKPSENGWVHTLNVFDHDLNEFMIMTDNRRQGEEESLEWLSSIKTITPPKG